MAEEKKPQEKPKEVNPTSKKKLSTLIARADAAIERSRRIIERFRKLAS